MVLGALMSVACDSKDLVPDDGGGKVEPPVPEPPLVVDWETSMLDVHPRVFLNAEMLPDIKLRAEGEENAAFAKIRLRVDQLLDKEIVFSDLYAVDGSKNSDHEYGMRAAESAFLYLMTSEKSYLDWTVKVLGALADYYEFRNANSLNIAWRASSRINALAAYDWVYNDMPEKERKEIGSKLLKEISYMLPGVNRPDFNRENRQEHESEGFYGTGVLSWYLGLVFYRTGIDDAKAAELLQRGFDRHMDVINYRKGMAGDDGGTSVACLEYALKAYPWAEFNFFRSLRSATGIDISSQCKYLALFPNFIYWSWIAGPNMEFGYGDADHWTNAFPTGQIHLHISQILDICGTQDLDLEMCNWLRTKAKKQEQTEFPIAPFLVTRNSAESAGSLRDNLPTARYFEKLGIVYMRSGNTTSDTYAMYSSGGDILGHRHYDNGHFTIYHKGFLAMDSGTRPEPGIHLPYYYCRTVAHNCITVRMPGERLPDYWGNPAQGEVKSGVPNDGGQCKLSNKGVIAFDENPEYVYIASDMSDSYSSKKIASLTRQFVYILPDVFIVYDRVNATDAGYPKRWLLHTAAEPNVVANTFYADHRDGRLFCTTVLPEKYVVTKIGGPGKQFWSDQKNWPLPNSNNEHEMYGQWRVEVGPQQQEEYDQFLHFIQVGDKSELSETSRIRVKRATKSGVSFSCNGKEYIVIFSSSGDVGGSITIKSGSNTLVQTTFPQTVKAQRGY